MPKKIMNTLPKHIILTPLRYEYLAQTHYSDFRPITHALSPKYLASSREATGVNFSVFYTP